MKEHIANWIAAAAFSVAFLYLCAWLDSGALLSQTKTTMQQI